MDTILVIDDQADVRMAAIVALNQIGYQCIEAHKALSRRWKSSTAVLLA